MTINFITQDMEIPPRRTWIASRLVLGHRGCTHEFIRGVEDFDAFARLQSVYLREGKYRFPALSVRIKNF